MLTGHTSWVESIAFSRDGELLASGSADRTIKMWWVSDGELLQTYDQETGTAVRSIQFSSDGRLFGYGRDDATVVLARDPLACDPCDMNCDGEVNAFDIEPFLDLLFGAGQPCDTCTGDVNGDGVIDAFDIEPFLECLFP